MNDTDKERVAAALRDIESRHGCRVLFAVESGSRAWGFASPDSDYDVWGVFVKPLDWYLQLKSDVPDTIVEELPGDIDVSLWDLRKALLQMAKSNASFLEWLGSPIIYRDCGIIAALNELKADCVNPAHLAYHYASMFRKAMETRNEDGTIRIKKLCYALRAALCLRYAMAVEKMPPTPFADVLAETKLEPDELDAIREVLAQKEHALESVTMTPDGRLADLLTDRYDSVAAHLWRKRGVTSDVYAKLEEAFRVYVKNEQGV
jgi:hypothetical protein